jgi:hypothetical protein
MIALILPGVASTPSARRGVWVLSLAVTVAVAVAVAVCVGVGVGVGVAVAVAVGVTVPRASLRFALQVAELFPL